MTRAAVRRKVICRLLGVTYDAPSRRLALFRGKSYRSRRRKAPVAWAQTRRRLRRSGRSRLSSQNFRCGVKCLRIFSMRIFFGCPSSSAPRDFQFRLKLYTSGADHRSGPRAPPFAGYPYRLPARLVKADRGERQEVAGRLRNAEESHSANRISQQDSIRIFTNYTQDRMYLKNPLGRCTRTIAAAAGSRSARRR
jgi:hypothetical protein